jgi:hypothetical protein
MFKRFDKKDTPVKSASKSKKTTVADEKTISPVFMPEEEEEDEIKKVKDQDILLDEKEEMDTANEAAADLEFGLD